MKCPFCKTVDCLKNGWSSAGTQMFLCPRCRHRSSERTQTGPFSGMRTDDEIVAIALTLLTRYKLSYRDVCSLLWDHFKVRRSHVALIKWVQRFGRSMRRWNRTHPIRFSRRWHADGLEITVGGRKAYIWVARDANGKMVNATLTRRKKGEATTRFFRNARRKSDRTPRRIVTDKCPSLRKGAKQVFPRARWIHGAMYKRLTNNLMEGYFGGNLRSMVERRREFKRFGSANSYLEVYQVVDNFRHQTRRPLHETILRWMRYA